MRLTGGKTIPPGAIRKKSDTDDKAFRNRAVRAWAERLVTAKIGLGNMTIADKALAFAKTPAAPTTRPAANAAPNVSPWGKVKNGLVLKIQTDKPRYKVGEQIVVTFVFKNTSARTIHLYDRKDKYGVWSHGFGFADLRGRMISMTSPALLELEKNQAGFIELKPGDQARHLVTLNNWKLAGNNKPYTKIGDEPRTIIVTGSYFTRVGWHPADQKAWGGIIQSGPIRIDITDAKATTAGATVSQPATQPAANRLGNWLNGERRTANPDVHQRFSRGSLFYSALVTLGLQEATTTVQRRLMVSC